MRVERERISRNRINVKVNFPEAMRAEQDELIRTQGKNSFNRTQYCITFYDAA